MFSRKKWATRQFPFVDCAPLGMRALPPRQQAPDVFADASLEEVARAAPTAEIGTPRVARSTRSARIGGGSDDDPMGTSLDPNIYPCALR